MTCSNAKTSRPAAVVHPAEVFHPAGASQQPARASQQPARASQPAAIVLAGGRGERLRPYTDDRPKPMVEVKGIPVIAYLLGWLAKYGITRIVLSCGYRWEVLRSALGNGHQWGLEILYAVEPEPLGRGGGIRFAMQSANGDNLLDFDLNAMLDQHTAASAEPALSTPKEPAAAMVTLALAPLVSARGIVDTDGQGRVTGFREKPELPYWINVGVYVLDPRVAHLLPAKGDHETDLFPRLAAQGKLAAFKTHQLWRTVDTAKDLATLSDELDAGLFFPCLDWSKRTLAP
jgi:NDP-sugar pyrophosphorylase family protein